MNAAALSVIIPVLNEAAHLPALLRSLHAQRDLDLECLVVDGGSSDDSVALAQHNGARVIHSARGRAVQMNAAARGANHDLLLFLHADSQLPHERLLADAVEAFSGSTRSGPLAGHFALRFARSDSGHAALFGFLEAKTATSRRYTINGDQGLLIRRSDFHALGGYDETLAILEDQVLAERIYRSGRWLRLPGHLITSARRFEREGHRARLILMALMMGAYHNGLPQFVAQAPDIYVEHAQGRQLRLSPFRRQLWALACVDGWRAALRFLWRCGGYGRDNLWQLALWRDVQRADGGQRCLMRFDQYLAPLLRNPLAQALTTLAVAIWFFLRLPLEQQD